MWALSDEVVAAVLAGQTQGGLNGLAAEACSELIGDIDVDPTEALRTSGAAPSWPGEQTGDPELACRQQSTGAPIVELLAPLCDGHEVWAAGVTYESSKLARIAESEGGGDFYARVYGAERPELFFKATPARTTGPGGAVRIRRDASWSVPEPELATLISATGEVLGYTIGNDMSSRDIEGENPLYLPQAKVYDGCCALGPWIVPAHSVDARKLEIRLAIERAGAAVFAGATRTARMRRSPHELATWLLRENSFPNGVVLLTGTGIIPPDDFTLQAGDLIRIEIDSIGALHNTVEQ